MSKNDEVCIKNEYFLKFKTRNFALKLMSFALKLMSFALKLMSFAGWLPIDVVSCLPIPYITQILAAMVFSHKNEDCLIKF